MVIVTLTGNAGVGKDTAAEYVCSKRGWNRIVSYTTRSMREGEVNGREHLFVNEMCVEESQLFAYTVYGGYQYWTTWDDFSKESVNLYVVDEKGLEDIEKLLSSHPEVSLYKVYIKASEDAIKERGCSPMRIARDKERKLNDESYYDEVINNCGSLEYMQLQLDLIADFIDVLIA